MESNLNEKYSIILPVCNGGEYVKACIASVLAQTYPHFNFIILDNCSTDGTTAWLQTITDARIQVIPASTPLTIEENWGRITTIAKNEWITLIGHDDILYPHFLQVIDDLVLANPNAALFHTHFNFINAQGQTIRAAKKMESQYSDAAFLSAFMQGHIDTMGTGYVMKSADYDRLGGIPVRYPNLLFADFELWIQLVRNSSIVISPANCFAFRLHQSTTKTSQDEKMHRALETFIVFLCGLKKQSAPLEQVINHHGVYFLQHATTSYAHRLLRSPLNVRNNISVAAFVEQSKKWAQMLGLDAHYLPEKNKSLRVALLIDKYAVSRKLFLLFKKIWAKPVL